MAKNKEPMKEEIPRMSDEGLPHQLPSVVVQTLAGPLAKKITMCIKQGVKGWLMVLLPPTPNPKHNNQNTSP